MAEPIKIRQFKATYRKLMLEMTREFDSVRVSFDGIPDLMEKYSRRIERAKG